MVHVLDVCLVTGYRVHGPDKGHVRAAGVSGRPVVKK